jgi:hypothetical protein
MIFDPFRVGNILTPVPVAMPPAIDFDAFGVNRNYSGRDSTMPYLRPDDVTQRRSSWPASENF